MQVKICGIQTEDAAKAAVEAGADFIGVVFAESKRQVSLEQANRLRRVIPKEVKMVGVFKDQPITQVNNIAQSIGLDFVQLHGNESLEECRRSQTAVIKGLSIGEQQMFLAYLSVVEKLLIDSPTPGSGQPFDWENLALPSDNPFFLAGGLTPENVERAILMAQPTGVDVSSGVETNGEKDSEKIRIFIKRAKQLS